MSDPQNPGPWKEAEEHNHEDCWDDESLLAEEVEESPEAKAARARRNWVLAGALLAFVILVFVVTIIRLGGHAFG